MKFVIIQRNGRFQVEHAKVFGEGATLKDLLQWLNVNVNSPSPVDTGLLHLEFRKEMS